MGSFRKAAVRETQWDTEQRDMAPGEACLLLSLVLLLVTKGWGEMVMDESSCHEVEEEECGLCHTVYMQECQKKLVEEMVPQKVWTCENVTRYEENCSMKMEEEEVAEKHPLCEVKSMNREHKACLLEKDKVACKRVMTCQLKKKMVKKMKEKKKCEKVSTGVVEEQCFDKVLVKKEKREKEVCEFQPKTMCHDSEGKECKKVKKKMCNYLDTNAI